MPVARAGTVEEACALLNAGKHKEVVLDFDIDADTFFEIATIFGNKGARFKRVNQRFIVRLKPFSIPS